MDRMISNASSRDYDEDNDVIDPDRSGPQDFELISRIGSGSFGTVFKVRRIQDGGIYVIKNVKISELSKKEQMEAINEVDLLAKMDSPYVVKYFDSFIAHSCLQIVMEFCNKGDLQKMIKRAEKKEMNSLGEKSTWNIVIQILLGLHYIHDMKVLHRDMKSANVFLMKDPAQDFYCVKIGDLGVAKVLDSSTAFAQSIVGTPYYLSPELCADLPYRDKSDVWALGVIVYECCMLSHPFDARNQCALIMKIVQAQMAPILPHVPPELRELILWILQKDPKDRPKIKEILNDKTVREKMFEHGFEVPAALANAEITDRIEYAVRGSVGSKKKTSMASTTSVVQTKTSVNSDMRSTTASGNTRPVGKPGGEVRGGRVRGRADAKISSSKARERHQVKTTVSNTRERGIASALQEKDTSLDSSGQGETEDSVDWNEAKRLLEQIAENDKNSSMASTVRKRVDDGADAKGSRGEDEHDEEVDYQYADDFEEYDDLDDEGSSSTMGGTNASTTTSTLHGERIRQASASTMDSEGLESDGSVTLRVESKDVDASRSARFDVVSPTWRVKSMRNPHSNDRTLVAGKDHSDDEQDEYKSDLRKSMTKKLDDEFLAGLDNLADLEDNDSDSSLVMRGEIGTVDGNTAMMEQELWRSIWSQGRGVLCSNRHIDADYLELEDEMMRNGADSSFCHDDEGSGGLTGEEKTIESKDAFDHKIDSKDVSSSDNTMESSAASRETVEEVLRAKHSRRAKILEGLIEDSRSRNIAAIGEVIFTRVYDLMSSMMYTPVTGNSSEDDVGISDRDKCELMELEKTLSQKFNGNKSAMCEVVFNVKKLLAIESSLERLHQSFVSTFEGRRSNKK